MTEYDYSPEAYERALRTQRRISAWVDQTERHAPANPFVPLPNEPQLPLAVKTRALHEAPDRPPSPGNEVDPPSRGLAHRSSDVPKKSNLKKTRSPPSALQLDQTYETTRRKDRYSALPPGLCVIVFKTRTAGLDGPRYTCIWACLLHLLLRSCSPWASLYSASLSAGPNADPCVPNATGIRCIAIASTQSLLGSTSDPECVHPRCRIRSRGPASTASSATAPAGTCEPYPGCLPAYTAGIPTTGSGLRSERRLGGCAAAEVCPGWPSTPDSAKGVGGLLGLDWTGIGLEVARTSNGHRTFSLDFI